MKKLISCLVCLMLMATFFTGVCFASETKADIPDNIKDTLTVALYDSPTVIFPPRDTSIPCIAVSVNMYENLFYFDLDKKELMPALAEKYEQIDDLTYRVFLRKGVKFHNGEEMTAEDVVYSINVVKESGRRAQVTQYYDIDNWEIVNDYEIVMKTTAPYYNFIKSLSDKTMIIFSREWYESAKNPDNEACGTGPYELVSFQASDKAVLKRFDEYWGDPAVTENLVIRFIEEENSRVLELETYGVDVDVQVSSLMVDQIKHTDHLEALEMDSMSVMFLAPNYMKKPFDNPLVRKALAHSYDAKVITEAILKETGVPESNPYLSPNATGYVELPAYEYDPELAKQCLEEAGYPDGIDVKLQFAANPTVGRVMEIIQAQMAACNIRAEVAPVESAMWGPLQANMEQEITYKGWTNTTDDPVRILGVSYSKSTGAGNNSTNYQNPEVDKLLDEAMQEFDYDKRMELCKEIQEIMHDEYNWLPLYTEKIVFAIHDRVRGFELVEPAFYQDYRNTYVVEE